MRRGPALALAVASGLLSVLLAVAVNVATGGTLPGRLAGLAWLAWPLVGVLAVVTAALAIWQPRPVAARSGAPAELPAEPAFFAGRGEDLTAAAGLAAGHRVVALVGPPGVGKTSLALRFAHDRRAGYPDGQLFALLRGADPDPVAPAAVLARFLRTLGVPDDERGGSMDDLAARLRTALAGRRVLILLDDARDAAQVRPLLPGGPGCLVVVTSRWMLGELPGVGQHAVGAMDERDARRLLTDAVGADRVAADPRGVTDLMRFCAGLPLALGIAAARLRARPAWTPGDMAARLADEHRRLDELHLGDLAVRSAFRTSYTEMPDRDRMVFRRAGTHPGRQFDAGAAAALADVPAAEAAAALERLVDAHLVESPAAGRYRLHDLLRLFAAERMAAEETAAERTASLVRLLEWLTAAAAPGDWLARERDNVLAAVHQAVRDGGHEAAWTLARTVGPMFRRAGDQPDLLAMWTDGLAAAEALNDDRRRLHALNRVSLGRLMTGATEAAAAAAQEAVTIAHRIGEPEALARARFTRGRVWRDQFRYARAEADLTSALDLFAALGDTGDQIEVLTTLGVMYTTERRPAEAVPLLERARRMETPPRAWTLQALSAAYQQSGRTAEAAELNREVIELAKRTDDEFVLGYALRERGWLATTTHRYAEADADMRAALAVFERTSNPAGLAGAHEAIGVVAGLAGRHADAITSLDRAIAVAERIGRPVDAGRSRLHKAHALAGLGRLDEARREAADAEAMIGDVPTPEVDWVRERLTALTTELS